MQELLAVQHLTVELLALLFEQRQGVAMDRDQVVTGDEQMDLEQGLGSSGLVLGAVEHEQHVVAVVVELRALVPIPPRPPAPADENRTARPAS